MRDLVRSLKAGGRWPEVLLAVATVAAAVFYVRMSQGLWFFHDAWWVLMHRTDSLDAATGVLAPYNGHWVTLPILLWDALFAVGGFRHYWAFAAALVIAHLILCLLCYVLLTRVGTRRWVAIPVVLALMVSGPGAENTLRDFQITFVGSALFAVAALITVVAEDSGLPWRTWLLSLASLMCSGMGLPLVGWIVLLAATRLGWRRAALVGAPLGLVYLVWFATAHRGAAPLRLPADTGTTLHAFFSGTAGVWLQALGLDRDATVLGLVLVAVLALAPLGVRRSQPVLASLAWTGLVGLVATYALVSYTRAGLGAETVLTGRYAYIGFVQTLPAVACLASVGAQIASRVPVLPAVAWLVAVWTAVAVGVPTIVTTHDIRVAEARGLQGRLVAEQRLATDPAVKVFPQSSDFRNFAITAQILARPRFRGTLPDVHPDETAWREARASVQVGVGPTRFDVPLAAKVAVEGLVDTPVRTPVCLSGKASVSTLIRLRPQGSGAQMSVTTSQGTLSTALTGPVGPTPFGVHRVEPEKVTWVATTVADEQLLVRPLPGPFTVCAGARVGRGVRN